jgi:putative transposase
MRGTHLCSMRTMYRILHERNQVRERRRGNQRTHYAKPELVATAPKQCWSWDITKLKGPATWRYFYLYVIVDLFSRYVVGWMVAHRESAVLAKQLITQTCAKHAINRDELTLHADRG